MRSAWNGVASISKPRMRLPVRDMWCGILLLSIPPDPNPRAGGKVDVPRTKQFRIQLCNVCYTDNVSGNDGSRQSAPNRRATLRAV